MPVSSTVSINLLFAAIYYAAAAAVIFVLFCVQTFICSTCLENLAKMQQILRDCFVCFNRSREVFFGTQIYKRGQTVFILAS